MCLKFVVMMSFQEYLYLLCKKGEEVMSLFGLHQCTRYCYFGLGEGEGLVAVKYDTADTEVRAPKVDREIDTLHYVSNARHSREFI